MATKEFVAAGSPGSTVVSAGTDLQSAVATSTTGAAPSLTYSTAAGLGRDSVGVAMRTPSSDDVCYMSIRNTLLAAGKGRVYGCLRNALPSGTGEVQFLQLSSNTGRIVKFQIAQASHPTLTPGTITLVDYAGSRIANTGVVWNVDEILHFYLAAQPGSTTSTGKVRAEIYDDDDVNLWTLANGNLTSPFTSIDALNAGTTQNVLELSPGRITANAAVPLDIDWLRPAINTDAAAIPANSTLPFVAKIPPPPDGIGLRVWVGDGWAA